MTQIANRLLEPSKPFTMSTKDALFRSFSKLSLAHLLRGAVKTGEPFTGVLENRRKLGAPGKTSKDIVLHLCVFFFTGKHCVPGSFSALHRVGCDLVFGPELGRFGEAVFADVCRVCAAFHTG